MRSLGAAALLLVAAMAGCIGADTSEQIKETQTLPEEEPGAVEVPQDLEMTGCSEQLGIFPMASPPDASFMPDGFASQNLFYLFAATCESEAAEGGSVSQLHAGLFVEPPDKLAHEEAVGHALPMGALVSDANVTSVFDDWNLRPVEGEVTVEVPADTPAARVGHVLASEGSFTVHMYSEATVSTEGEPGVVRFFGVEDGEVTNAVDMRWTEASALQGEATFALEGSTSPFPPPAEPGLVEHWWGEDYAFTFTHRTLEEIGAG